MNRNHQIWFSLMLFVMAGTAIRAQEKSKTYKETFNVDKEAVINLNTSYADIEFETWDKDQVEVTAVVELEGATDEEATSYFEKDLIKIMGNSKEIEVHTQGNSFGPMVYDFNNFNFVVPDVPSVEHILAEVEIPEIPEIPEIVVIPELPPMPPMPFMEFDYEAYKKDGDKYLKEWKKDFDKNFDKEYKKRFEEWSDQLKDRTKEREEMRKQMQEDRKQLMKDREQLRVEIRQEVKAQREEMRNQREEIRHENERVMRIHNDGPNVFYFSSKDGEHKEYKVKKRIKIKMPKYIKLKMDVRHGEVKLAANTKNINASLSYASLLASTIDGHKTSIKASYSPIVVQQWNYGQLQTDFAENVNLNEVKELQLNSVSSNVIIGRLKGKALVNSTLGALSIDAVSDSFTNLDVSVENAEVEFKMPSVPFAIYVNGTASEFTYPKTMVLETSKSHNAQIHKGYYISKSDDKSITINSRYSDVVLKQ